jgi:hypothetical protein
MAFDQVSLFLYPPRWRRQSIADTTMVHYYSGEPVHMVSAVRDGEFDGPVVHFDEVCRWFEAKHFEVVNRSVEFGHFCSAKIESALGLRPEITVSTSTVDLEVTELYCRFLLNRDAPFRLERWEAFIHELCREFKTRISISDTESVGPDEFVTVVRQTDQWRSFADQFGWTHAAE